MKVRTILPASLPIFVLAFSSPAAEHSGWHPDPDQVKQLTENRPEFNYKESRVPEYDLPPLLNTRDGNPIESKEAWETKRRPEVLNLFRKHVYGRRRGEPDRLEFVEIEKNNQAMDGAATLKRIEIQCGQGDETFSFELVLFLPNANERSQPAPVFLLINHRDPSNIDPTRKHKSDFWPAEEVIERGFGIAAFQATVVDPDSHDSFKNGVHGLFDQKPRRPDSWATLAAWGWGASRCMDYLETDPDVDADHVAVVGHSRGGKASLWADPRGEFLSLKNADPVYQLYGFDTFENIDMPPVNSPVHKERMGYHIRQGGHDLKSYDWHRFIDFVEEDWLR